MPTQTPASVLQDIAALTLVLGLTAGPAAMTFALVQHDNSGAATERSFHEALEGAVKTYQTRTSAQTHRNRRLQELRAQEQELQDVMGEKAVGRLR